MKLQGPDCDRGSKGTDAVGSNCLKGSKKAQNNNKTRQTNSVVCLKTRQKNSIVRSESRAPTLDIFFLLLLVLLLLQLLVVVVVVVVVVIVVE